MIFSPSDDIGFGHFGHFGQHFGIFVVVAFFALWEHLYMGPFK
jgi:hypothetical protein